MPRDSQLVYSSYEEAAAAAKIRWSSGRTVTKVEHSPYGSGFAARSFPVGLLLRQRTRQMSRPVTYDSL